MLGVKATTEKAASFQWTEDEVKELVQNSTLPDHWTSGSIITYRLVNWCIVIIRYKKMVMKHRLPELCQLLETSRCEGQSSEATKKAPLTPNQVASFVQKVENKMRGGKMQYESVVEFPKSASKGSKKTDSRKTAATSQSSASPPSVSDVTLNDKVKSDIEEVVGESYDNLVELHTLIKKLEEAEVNHMCRSLDDEAYKGLVEEFKSAHQKNIMDKRGIDAKLGVIELCNPFEDENNKALEELIQEKHKVLARAHHDEELYCRVVLCGGLDWQEEPDVRAREGRAMRLVSKVLEIDYKGEPDPVDFAHSLKSILEYVVGVVPKHLGKEPAEEDEEAAGSSSGRPRRRQGRVGSQEWKDSWKKHFEDAAEESKSLAELQRELKLERETAELQKRLQAAQERRRQLEAELEKQKCVQQLMSEIGDLERQRDQILADALAGIDSDSDTEETPKKRTCRRSPRSGKNHRRRSKG